MNTGLLVRVRSLLASTEEGGSAFVSRTVEELRTQVPDYEGRVFKDGEQPSEDHMILSLLIQVVNGVKNKGGEKEGEEGRKKLLLGELKEHEKKLVERQFEVEMEEQELEAEAKRFITSEDLHVGFESKTVSSLLPLS